MLEYIVCTLFRTQPVICCCNAFQIKSLCRAVLYCLAFYFALSYVRSLLIFISLNSWDFFFLPAISFPSSICLHLHPLHLIASHQIDLRSEIRLTLIRRNPSLFSTDKTCHVRHKAFLQPGWLCRLSLFSVFRTQKLQCRVCCWNVKAGLWGCCG